MADELEKQIPDDQEDIQASIDRRELELQEWRARQASIAEENRLKENLDKVRGPVQDLLASHNCDENEIRQIIKSMGGYRIFEFDHETGDVMLAFAGLKLPIRDCLPEHPIVRAVLSQGNSTTRSAESQRQNRIAELESRRSEIKSRDPRSVGNMMLAELGQIGKELTALRAAAPVHKKEPGIADPNLIIRRKMLIRKRDEVQQQFRQTGGTRNDLLIEAGKLSREINSISSQIANQQAG